MLDILLFCSGCIVLVVSLLLTIKTGFIQFRGLPQLIKLFLRSEIGGDPNTIGARRALLTAMSTTIGVSTIVAPAIAIRLGGPGAVLGFIIATILGAATSYSEVTFALRYRKQQEGRVEGGPMQYLQDAFSPLLAKWYALFCGILMLVWSSAQSNQIAELFHSSLMRGCPIPKWLTGVLLAVSVCIMLVGGIRWIASLSARLVPLMFCVYVGSSLWIILLNFSKLPEIFALVLRSCWEPQAFGGGVVVGGILSTLRWGALKALQGNEAGVGTQTFPHSTANTRSPTEQGIMAMASTYCAGFVLVISSLTTLISGSWLDPKYSLGIDMVLGTYNQYFSYLGSILVAISALLFVFGTVLGNSYNGSQCYLYLTKGRAMIVYYFLTALMILVGALGNVQTVWSSIDLVLVFVIVPHIVAVLWLAMKDKQSLRGLQTPLQESSEAVL